MAAHRNCRNLTLIIALLAPSALYAGEYRHPHLTSAAPRDAYAGYYYFRESHRHGSRRIVVANHHQRPSRPRSVFVDPVGYAYPAIKYRNRASGYRALPDGPTSTTLPTSTQNAPSRRTPRLLPK
jgi:hypothetical protein